mmetsp:Transcript_16980/g.25926  ORF Transcript_16980/g.25926 Transcript_16980/m.25926 type:complete len:88 (-) Transcript_16980:59-322(-)
MVEAMPLIGAAIHSKMSFVPRDVPIHLNLDNAGGHGTKEAILTYCHQLAESFNIILVHQLPRSPELNMLDLGTWRVLQSSVEKTHTL